MRIAVLAFDGVTTFHLAAPELVFGEVGRQHAATDWVTTLWALDGDSVRTAEGYRLGPVAGPEVVADADVVVVPSWHPPPAPVDPRLCDLLVAAHARGAVVVGLCLGAFPLAAAGLLDGRRAATHWLATDQLAAQHPATVVDATALYVDHGDVLTSAGTAASIDACLHLVRTRLGAAAAARVARALVVAPHREGGQAQYIERPVAGPAEDDPVSRVMAWALTRLDEPLPVERLAEQAHMSRRGFVRHFRRVTGTTPARWVLSRRLDEARVLLETTTWSIGRVAGACGFASTVTFRQAFVAQFAVPPSSYRRQFAEPPAPAGRAG
ncbi:GlxA family transcriptional regulator [Nocardioides dongxiaopingii]|uniref:GlxA family transcriptional regulator n=1 Tax=Nocardioides dongxiaopingii TaxID=2576036 RepID=UPI0010C76407|nr:helix-turn-helix domain-containing protein [Nocardioides dongxiaopingii]